MKPAICIEMLYPGLSPEEKIRRVADMGFRCIEFWGYKDKDLEAIRNLKEDYSVQIVNFSGQRREISSMPPCTPYCFMK
jgi:hydroxypyruvate isomerase